MKKQKLLIISPYFKEPHAWTISAYKTAVGLVKYFDVIVLTSQTKDSKPFEVVEGVKVFRSNSIYIPDPANYAFTPWIFRDLQKIVREEDPDFFLISKYMFFSSFTGFWLRLHNRRYILQTDTFPGFCWFKEWKGLSIPLNFIAWVYTQTVGKLILKLADRVVVLYDDLITQAQRLGLKDPVCIPNGVDYEKFTKAQPAKDILKFKGDSVLVTFLGRLDKVKGYHLALRLADELKDKAKFLFVCGGKDKDKRARLSRKYPHVKFLGFRKDVAEIFQASDIHILPSSAEGLPNSVMEAMAARCAVVASKVGGIPFIINEDSQGLLFDRGDYESMRSKVLQLIDDSKVLKEIKVQAARRIRNRFNLAMNHKQLMRVFRDG